MKRSRSDIFRTRPYLIAECAYSHEGDVEYLRKSVVSAAESACVDAVKFHILLDINTYMCPDHDLYERIREWMFTADQWREVIGLARSSGLGVIVLADDLGSFALLEEMKEDIAAVEIHSCSLNDAKMLEKTSLLNVPVILGVGGSSAEDIALSVDYLKKRGTTELLLMYGFQNYPTRYEYVNFEKMKKVQQMFGLPVGYADHTSWDDENNEVWSA